METKYKERVLFFDGANVFGAWKIARAVYKTWREKFVLISTYKAVDPTNIMVPSKRMCEMIVLFVIFQETWKKLFPGFEKKVYRII